MTRDLPPWGVGVPHVPAMANVGCTLKAFALLVFTMAAVVLRLPEVVRRTGLSRSTLYNRIAAGAFPRPLRLGDRSVGWLESEVDDWINRLVELRDRMQAD